MRDPTSHTDRHAGRVPGLSEVAETRLQPPLAAAVTPGKPSATRSATRRRGAASMRTSRRTPTAASWTRSSKRSASTPNGLGREPETNSPACSRWTSSSPLRLAAAPRRWPHSLPAGKSPPPCRGGTAARRELWLASAHAAVPADHAGTIRRWVEDTTPLVANGVLEDVT